MIDDVCKAAGLAVERRFTVREHDPFAGVRWTRKTSRITNPDGSVVFEMADAEVPADWSQVASDIMVSKYFRKAGVPQVDAQGEPILDETGNPVLGPERSARHILIRPELTPLDVTRARERADSIAGALRAGAAIAPLAAATNTPAHSARLMPAPPPTPAPAPPPRARTPGARC